MTKDKTWKRAVRARMKATGERYTTARAQLLRKQAETPAVKGPGRGDSKGGYPFAPGLCRDTGAVTNWLQASGVHREDGAFLNEALVTALAGGVGFLYIVFEYKGLPPLLSVLTRYDSAAERFAVAGLERLDLPLETLQTTSAKKAQAALDAALDEGRPALCVVDAGALSASGSPEALSMPAGMAPTIVSAVAREGDTLLVDLGALEPASIGVEDFARARQAYRKAKQQMWTLPKGEHLVEAAELSTALRGAFADCARRYTEAPYKGYASNFGLAGMEKWARLLVDEKDPKGWARLFPEGRAACTGLRRAYQGLEVELTSPGAGRFVFADALRQAAGLGPVLEGADLKRAALERAADAFEDAGSSWSAVATAILVCGADEVRSGCELLDEYAALLDAQAPFSERRAAAERVSASASESSLDAAAAKAIYRDLAERVGDAVASERAALAQLEKALN